MIVTFTPNPALDLGGIVDQLTPNEKNYVSDETKFAGGNGLNSARIIRRLGAPVLATGFLGGAVGDEIRELLRRERIRQEFIATNGSTRINLTISNRATHTQTRLSFPGPTISAREWRQYVGQTRKRKKISLFVVGGSLPPGIQVDEIGDLLHELNSRGVPTVVDMPGQLLRKTLTSIPLLIKPNLQEFQALTNTVASEIPDVLRCARRLTNKVGMVCVSSVANGALAITKNGVWYGKTPKLKIRSTVGAGDAMVGAMTTVLNRRKVHHLSFENRLKKLDALGGELLQWGLAAAAATLMQPGMVMATRADIEKYVDKVEIENLS